VPFALASVLRRIRRGPVDVEGRDIRPAVLRLLLALMLLGAVAFAVEYVATGRPFLTLWLLPYVVPAMAGLIALRRWKYARIAPAVLYYFLVLTVGLRLFCEPTYAIDFINLPIYAAAAFYLLTPLSALAYSALMFVGLLAASLVVYLFRPLPILYTHAANPNAVWISSIVSGIVFSAVAFQLSRESQARLRRLHAARDALDSLNEDYRNLIRVVIHDFANEIFKAQLVLDDEAAGRGDAATALANISELVAHLRRLEESAGVREDRHLTPVPIELLIERLRLSFRTQLRRRHLKLVVEGDTDAQVLTDPAVLAIHVLGNLLSNAIKYSLSPGEIGLRIEAHEATVRISVSNVTTDDNPAALRERLEGKRASPSERGQGIGLAIVRRFCDVLGYPLEARLATNGDVAVVMTVTVPRVIDAIDAERPLAPAPA